MDAHTIREGNKEADRLANMAMNRGNGIAETTPVLHFSLATSAPPQEAAPVTAQAEDEDFSADIQAGTTDAQAASGNILLVDGSGKAVAAVFTREVAEKIAASCGYVIADRADNLDFRSLRGVLVRPSAIHAQQALQRGPLWRCRGTPMQLIQEHAGRNRKLDDPAEL
jgi:hypothetical protein